MIGLLKLVARRPSVNQEKRLRVYIPEIAEIGNCAVAQFLVDAGYEVSGYTGRSTPGLERLIEAGARITQGEGDPGRLGNYTHLMSAPGIVLNDAFREAAEREGVEVVARNAILAEVSRPSRTIGVTGTHGKGNVAAMIAWILELGGLEPGFIIGGEVRNFGTNARRGRGEWLVMEVDESDGSHQLVHCDYALCNFLELAHLEYYQGMEEILLEMKGFFESNPRLKEAFINLDCLGNRRLVEELNLRPTGYSTAHRSEFRAQLKPAEEGEEGSWFEAFHREESLGEFHLSLPGAYQVVNALGAMAITRRLGVEPAVIGEALKSFEGIRDRHIRTRGGGVEVVKDLTVHPTGIAAVLAAERKRVGKEQELVVVFQPRDRSLLRFLRQEYVQAFTEADHLVVGAAKNLPSGEGVGDVESLVGQLRDDARRVVYLPSEKDIGTYLLKVLRPGVEVVFFGDEEFLSRGDQLLAELALQAERTRPEEEQPRLDGPLTQGGSDES